MFSVIFSLSSLIRSTILLFLESHPVLVDYAMFTILAMNVWKAVCHGIGCIIRVYSMSLMFTDYPSNPKFCIS